jgi:hypothetical protein
MPATLACARDKQRTAGHGFSATHSLSRPPTEELRQLDSEGAHAPSTPRDEDLPNGIQRVSSLGGTEGCEVTTLEPVVTPASR